MFNFTYTIIALLFFVLTFDLFFKKTSVLVMLVMWYLFIASYILEIYLYAVTYDPELTIFAVFLLVLTFVEAICTIVYVYRTYNYSVPPLPFLLFGK